MKGLLAGIAATAAVLGGLAIAGVFSGGGGQAPAPSFKTGPGLQVMIDVGFWAPKGATSGDPQPARRTYNVNPQEYAAFVKAVVKRYSGTYVPKYGVPPPPDQAHSSDSDLLHSVMGSAGA